MLSLSNYSLFFLLLFQPFVSKSMEDDIVHTTYGTTMPIKKGDSTFLVHLIDSPGHIDVMSETGSIDVNYFAQSSGAKKSNSHKKVFTHDSKKYNTKKEKPNATPTVQDDNPLKSEDKRLLDAYNNRLIILEKETKKRLNALAANNTYLFNEKNRLSITINSIQADIAAYQKTSCYTISLLVATTSISWGTALWWYLYT